MAENSRELKTISTAKENKSNPYSKDIIVDPMGQWKHPGKVTKIPSNNITMKGVPYPVLGVDNLGNIQMMMPGGSYIFAGSSVTEYPMMYGGDPSLPAITGHYQKGGWLDKYEQDEFRLGGFSREALKRTSRKTTSKNIQSSINKLFLRNEDLFGPSGKRVYDPKSKKQEGGQANGWLDKYK